MPRCLLAKLCMQDITGEMHGLTDRLTDGLTYGLTNRFIKSFL